MAPPPTGPKAGSPAPSARFAPQTSARLLPAGIPRRAGLPVEIELVEPENHREILGLPLLFIGVAVAHAKAHHHTAAKGILPVVRGRDVGDAVLRSPPHHGAAGLGHDASVPKFFEQAIAQIICAARAQVDIADGSVVLPEADRIVIAARPGARQGIPLPPKELRLLHAFQRKPRQKAVCRRVAENFEKGRQIAMLKGPQQKPAALQNKAALFRHERLPSLRLWANLSPKSPFYFSLLRRQGAFFAFSLGPAKARAFLLFSPPLPGLFSSRRPLFPGQFSEKEVPAH